MEEGLQKSLFIHQNMDSPLYYLTGTIVLSLAIVALVIITVYSIYNIVRKTKNSKLAPAELKEFSKIGLVNFILILLGSFAAFVISINIYPVIILDGWAQKAGVLLFAPFFFAITVGGLGKVSNFKDNAFIHSLSFWKVYLFVLVFLGLRAALL